MNTLRVPHTHPPVVHDDPAMRGPRSRNADGRLRQKRGDTHLGSLEDCYGEISDRRRDTHLETLRRLRGMSLSKMVRSGPEVTHKPGLNGRHRNQDGTLRSKRGDTLLSTLRQTYGQDFAACLPGWLPLALVREMTGMSLTQMVRHPEVFEEYCRA
ncbi:MAG TPA: hypothetical protein VNO81_12845 [Candidatus Nitrosotenuis sp.]|nr:hypothetical protein [Candidatus Nitrosotenuis sp.]